MRMRMLLASALLVLGGCGDDDADGDGGGDDTTDHRSNVTGAYDSTGTMSASLNGQSETQDLEDTVRISAASGSSRTALNIRAESFSCDQDLRATMTGENTFSINEGSCEIFVEQLNCLANLSVTSGRGSRATNGPLQLSLEGKFTVSCIPLPVVGDFTLQVTGTRTGAESLPDVETLKLHVTRP